MKSLPVLYFYIGQRIRGYRLDRGLSQEDLAKKINVARTTLTHWEEGKNKIQIDDVYTIAKYFGVSVNELLPNNTDKLMKTQDEAFLEFLNTQPAKEE